MACFTLGGHPVQSMIYEKWISSDRYMLYDGILKQGLLWIVGTVGDILCYNISKWLCFDKSFVGPWWQVPVGVVDIAASTTSSKSIGHNIFASQVSGSLTNQTGHLASEDVDIILSFVLVKVGDVRF